MILRLLIRYFELQFSDQLLPKLEVKVDNIDKNNIGCIDLISFRRKISNISDS